jgi:hypothetical protein
MGLQAEIDAFSWRYPNLLNKVFEIPERVDRILQADPARLEAVLQTDPATLDGFLQIDPAEKKTFCYDTITKEDTGSYIQDLEERHLYFDAF